MYYAVRVGRTPGIYYNWEACKRQIYQYKGAVYKKFDNYMDAQRFLGGAEEISSGTAKGIWYAVKEGPARGIYSSHGEMQKATGLVAPENREFRSREEAQMYLDGADYWERAVQDDIANGYLVAFTDGSFLNGVYAWGVIIMNQDGVIKTINGKDADKAFVSTRNIAGEVLGAIGAIEWAMKNGYKKLSIYHDYQGIAFWLDNTWQCKSPIAIMYRQIYDTYYYKKIELKFTHVLAHSGIKYNEMADKLAKEAAGGKK